MEKTSWKTARDIAEIKLEKSEKALEDLREKFVKLRQDLRQLISEYGIRSNPGWSEEDIIFALRCLLEEKTKR